MKHITLFVANGSWMAKSDDPTILKLFGTDTLPTAYTDEANAADVLSAIQALNPGVQVKVQP